MFHTAILCINLKEAGPPKQAAQLPLIFLDQHNGQDTPGEGEVSGVLAAVFQGWVVIVHLPENMPHAFQLEGAEIVLTIPLHD